MSQSQPPLSYSLATLCSFNQLRCLSLAGFVLFLAGCQTTSQQSMPNIDSTDGSAQASHHAWNTKLEPLRKGVDARDIWERIRNGYKLQDQIGNNPRVDQQRFGFASRPDSLQQIAERSNPYIHYIVERLEQNDLPLELALLPMIESSYNPFAYSPAQAAGLWQFIPSTGKNFNLRQTNWYDGRRDITASTNAAILYLQRLHDMFNGDWLLALAAYNAGEGTVSRAIERNERQGLPTDYWNLPLPRETQDYVPKLLALSQIIQTPSSYGINLIPIANQPYFERVELRHELDLSKVADLADMKEGELVQLNPAFKKGITVDGPKHVLVPVDKANELHENLARLPVSAALPKWQRYQANKKDTIDSVANKFHVSAESIRNLNKIHGNKLKNKQELLIPTNSELFYSVNLATNSQIVNPATINNKNSSKKSSKEEKINLKGTKLQSQKEIRASQQAQANNTKKINNDKNTGKKNSAKQSLSSQHSVRNGETIWTISRKYDIPVKEIQRLNPKIGAQLKPGQSIILPSSTKR